MNIIYLKLWQNASGTYCYSIKYLWTKNFKDFFVYLYEFEAQKITRSRLRAGLVFMKYFVVLLHILQAGFVTHTF